MSPDDNAAIDGQTPPDPDELDGVIPSIGTRGELNAFEQANIAQALVWASRSRKLKKDLLSLDSLRLIHRRMFDQTWKWAGTFRTTGKNLGVEPHQIQTQLIALCGNAKYWIENEVYALDECAIRLHHKMVFIHPFPNGNGRHARLTADLLLTFGKQRPLTWGGASIDAAGETRTAYILALRAADKGDYGPLIEFARRA